jgi:glucose/arabinose dehydrogenase
MRLPYPRPSRLAFLVILGFTLLASAACRGSASPATAPAGSPDTTGASGATNATPKPGEPTATGSASATASDATGSAGSPGGSTSEPRPVSLVPVSGRNWERPTEMGPYPSASGGAPGIFVVEQDGVVYEVAAGGAVTTILDLRDIVLRSGNEEGFLSLALDPGFASNRYVWTYYSMANPRRTVLVRYTRQASAPTIDRASQLVVLEVGQPFANHNGGAIRFGPDGMLYLGLGDGGSAGDPTGNGQNLNTLLGKIIRLDVRNASASQRYAVPGDNPFVGRAGARGEIWAYGMRNPWRMSFDPATGALWVGDVGQGAVEEIDIVTRGGNFGWGVVEGDRCYKPATGCNREGMTPPVAVYGHDNGRCSVVGGFVYRGSRVPEIAGAYVYGDTCSGEIWAVNAAAPKAPVRIASGVRNMTSFGLDAAGEITVLGFGQPIRRLATP